MTGGFVLEVLIFNGLIPGGVAAALVVLIHWTLPAEVGQRYAAPAAVAVAFAVGYVLLPDWAPLKPGEYWQWLPALALVAALVAAVAAAKGVTLTEHGLITALLAAVAAALLIPTWPDLQTAWLRYFALLACYLFALSVLVSPLMTRLSPRVNLAALALASGATAALTAYYVSLKFGHLAIIHTAALAGCAAALLIVRGVSLSAALAAVYGILAGGVAWVGAINPQPPLYGLLVVPAAPLALWLSLAGPLGRLKGWRAAATSTVLCLLAIGAGWLAVIWGVQ